MAQWTSERLFFEGDEYYQDLLNAIECAETRVDFETYIFDDDEVGALFSAALTRAAARGVKTRLLVDGIGSAKWISLRAAGLRASGVEVRVYHPVKASAIFGNLLGEVGFRKRTAERSVEVFSRFNRRDHRKLAVIDEKRAWLGSLNISADHSQKFSGPHAWRDTGVRVEGEGITDFATGFEYAWVRAHDLEGRRRWTAALMPLKRARSRLVRLNYTLRMRRRNFHELASHLRRAERRIWITNAYLAPSMPVIRSLRRAANRGVDVRVLVPHKSDVFFMPWVAGSHYPQLLKSGVRIFEYLPRFLHAKTVMIDDWATVGSSNLNRRSLMHDLEVDIVLTGARSMQELEEQFATDLTFAAEVHAGPHRLTAFIGRMIISLMKNWI